MTHSIYLDPLNPINLVSNYEEILNLYHKYPYRYFYLFYYTSLNLIFYECCTVIINLSTPKFPNKLV